MDVFVLALNVVLALVPLSTGTRYGQDDEAGSLTLCSLSVGKGDTEDETRWNRYAFELELYISFIVIIIFSTIIACYSLNFGNIKSSNVYLNERIKDSWKIVILYPLAMMVTWLPSQAYAFYADSYFSNHGRLPKNVFVVANYLNALNILYGPLLSIIFYTKTLDARRAWMHNLRGIMYVTMSIDIDDRTTCESIISMDDARVSEVEQSPSTHYSPWSNITNLTTSLLQRDHSNKNKEDNRVYATNAIGDQMNPMSNVNSAIVRIGEDL
jgi:hypothetical protein